MSEEMKAIPAAIPTWYKGVRYDSKKEAKLAVYLDEAGFKHEVKPGRFDLGNGFLYWPDFLVHGVWLANCEWSCYVGDVYVEMKGKWKDSDEDKVDLLWRTKGKNILTVDEILWPGEAWYDKRYDTSLYKELSKNMRKAKEKKEASGAGSDLEFTLSLVGKCDMCDRTCGNIVFSGGAASKQNEICFHDLGWYNNAAFCIGINGEPIIYNFAPCEDDDGGEFAEREAGFNEVCDTEKTRAAYLKACRYEDDGSGSNEHSSETPRATNAAL